MANNTVELLGYYGGDTTHALSAWTSTERELTDDKRGRMDKLLNFLASEGHHTPFEKSYLHFLVRCDTASHIHQLKHRIAVSVNGESARYKELTPSFYIPTDWPVDLQSDLLEHCAESNRLYHRTIDVLEQEGYDRKRAKESARFYLPYASQVTLDIGFNFRSFMAFQKLRNAEDAQREISMIAQDMLKLVKETEAFPLSLEAFNEH